MAIDVSRFGIDIAEGVATIKPEEGYNPYKEALAANGEVSEADVRLTLALTPILSKTFSLKKNVESFTITGNTSLGFIDSAPVTALLISLLHKLSVSSNILLTCKSV
jgi:hypothetical protein